MPDAPVCDIDATGKKISYCPFGCEPDDLDEYGHCRHLIGYTNDGKTYERTGPLMRKTFGPNPQMIDTGYKQTVGVQKRGEKLPAIPEGAQLINPEFPQYDKGVMHMAKKWVSERVYVEKPETSVAKVHAAK